AAPHREVPPVPAGRACQPTALGSYHPDGAIRSSAGDSRASAAFAPGPLATFDPTDSPSALAVRRYRGASVPAVRAVAQAAAAAPLVPARYRRPAARPRVRAVAR